MVMNYTNDRNNVPERRGDRIALERLLNVLINLKDIEEALKNAQSAKEVDWTITLAHHLLRNLAVNQTYVVDNHYAGRSCICFCCKQTITGSFGDTSIGCTAVWHGYLDLILGSEVPVKAAEDDDEVVCEGNKSSSEFPAKLRDQLIAQTIVFSFLQKKEKSTYENYLIPSIGIAKKHVVLFLYDSEHDILLESKLIKLWSPGGHIITSAVLALWLAINFSFTCSGVTEHMKNCGFTADFPKQVGKELKVYEKCLRFGCGPGSEVKEMFEPEVYDIFNLH
ncbi:uncharacterized protein LOC128556873 [Mercenaria mercenaria]|uniref:uncharacterized protein LOC128556873 n=1 Tax=Mercenaria mercenaria TaxID=6596 RepID=UPI00234EABB6|nr:uncharacterized protein LOC128556873 [Mercenaria mercenaria]